MRAFFVFFRAQARLLPLARFLPLAVLVSLLAGAAPAQIPLEVGAPDTAFAGGPIRLSKAATERLRIHFQGDKVPRIPQPFRGRLDTALAARDWPKVEAAKAALIAARGLALALMWEQSRFIATGGIGIAQMHALDIATAGSTGVMETAAMMWLYAVAVTMTDGHKCANPAAKEAHMDRLLGPEFEPASRIVRVMAEDRLAAMRDLAIRLEAVLAVDRTDDTMCRVDDAKPEIKPDAVWRPEMANTRGMLPRHLTALTGVMRPKPAAEPAKPGPPKTAPAANR